MKRTTSFLSFILSIALLFPSISFSREIVRINFSQDPWPPYTLGEKGTPSGGIAVDITQEIFKRLNILTTIKLFPWKRALRQMELGERDGIMLLTQNKKREDYMDFTDTIIEDHDLIWYMPKHFIAKWKKPFEWKNLEELNAYQIGETAGFNYGESYQKASKALHYKVQQTDTDTQNFEKLVMGRIDIFICNETVAREIFNQHPNMKGILRAAERPLKTVNLRMAFSKKSVAKTLIPKINEVIARLKKEGVISKIQNK